jgi:hypothetical protein
MDNDARFIHSWLHRQAYILVILDGIAERPDDDRYDVHYEKQDDKLYP